jgi:hypothetical protein
MDEKFEDLEKNKYKIELKNERLRQDKKDWKENGLSTLKGSYNIVSKERQNEVSEINVFLNITDKDKEEIEEIKITDFKVGTKVTWEMFGKTKCGIISKIDPKSKKNISVKEHGGGTREIAFYKLVIITDKEYKDCIDPPKDELEEIIQSVEPPVVVEVPEELAPDKPPSDKPPPVIGTGSEVQWTDKSGKVLTGKIEKTSNKTYTICCKPNGTRYRIQKNDVKLLEIPEAEEAPVEGVAPAEVEAPVEAEAPAEEAPAEDPSPEEIATGSEVQWIDKNGKVLTGKIEKTSNKTYTICCKPNGTRYRIQKNIVKLN